MSMMAGGSTAYARSIPLLAEDLTIIRPTILMCVPRIFERIYNAIHAKLDEGSPLKKKFGPGSSSICGVRPSVIAINLPLPVALKPWAITTRAPFAASLLEGDGIFLNVKLLVAAAPVLRSTRTLTSA